MKTPILLLSLFAASTLTAAPWTSGGPHAGYFDSLSAVASNPSIVYAAGRQGVFRTDDNGATWRDVSNRLRATLFVAADPFDPDIAYAIAAGDARFSQRTDDGGATWTAMDTGPRTNTILIDPNDSKTPSVTARMDRTCCAPMTMACTGRRNPPAGFRENRSTDGFPISRSIR